MAKWTTSKIKKMSKQELQEVIDRAKGVQTVYSSASKEELQRELIFLINQGEV